MDAKALKESTAGARPPEGLSGPLQALWHVAKGDWDKAHALVQDDESKAAAWVHAHLHRIEGDQSNADYWYARAGKPRPEGSTDDEWPVIAAQLLVTI